jgi:glyoxylase-like metal-dependent hydrolase (beta-lactamase superfamily II)
MNWKIPFMKNLVYITILLSVAFYSSTLEAQKKEVTIIIDSLAQDVYMLTGQGGNIGIYVGETHVFMIDDQFDRLSEKIKTAIATLTDKPIAYLFNTHMHGDHSGGNARFNTETVTLVAQDNVRERIAMNLKKKLESNEMSNDDYLKMLPEVTFSEDITFYDGLETIMAFHVHNAHTDGDAMVYFTQNNILHMGDTYFSGRYPYIDLKSGGSIDGYITAHQKALMVINDDTKIIPGHGRPSNKKELEVYVTMLKNIRSTIQTEIDKGKSLEEVKANASLTQSYDETHGSGFINPERIREIVYSSLMNARE